MSVLQAEFLAKSYKSRKVVSDVSLTVNSNEIVGLLGPNGAGKTTTFYMVVGLVRHVREKSPLMAMILAYYLCMNVHVEELAIYHKKLYFPSFNSL